jgi:predicted dehydrogenase
MLDEAKPEGVVIATPNHLHVPAALACVARKIPAIVEKPVADTVEEAMKLVRAAQEAGVPMLTGHHRRHNPVMRKAADYVRGGHLGRVTAVNALWLNRKPDDYYQIAWRREPGGGPILINAIHDIDCMRMVCGEIESIQAVSANAARGFPVEDSAAALIRFESGAIGTYIISDTVPGSWNWELSSGENTMYPHEDGVCMIVGGTRGSLTIPNLDISADEKGGGWIEPLTRRRISAVPADPYVEQLKHFGRVIRDGEKPVIDIAEGTRTLAATLAISRSARIGTAVKIAEMLKGGG